MPLTPEEAHRLRMAMLFVKRKYAPSDTDASAVCDFVERTLAAHTPQTTHQTP